MWCILLVEESLALISNWSHRLFCCISTNVHCGHSQQSKQMRAELSSLYLFIKIGLFKHENKLGQWNCRHRDKWAKLAATHVQSVFLLFTFYHRFGLGRYSRPWLSFRFIQVLPHECLEKYLIGHVRAFQCQTFNIKLSISSFTAKVVIFNPGILIIFSVKGS